MYKTQDQINDVLMDRLDELQKINSSQNADILVQIAKLPAEMADKFDARYASKRTEIAVDRLAWLVVTAVLGAILLLIIK